MLSNQTFSTSPVFGQKKDKIRIMILLDINVTGTDKLTPWVIGNVKCLRALLRINLEQLPVYYRANSKTWMNSSIFEKML